MPIYVTLILNMYIYVIIIRIKLIKWMAGLVHDGLMVILIQLDDLLISVVNIYFR